MDLRDASLKDVKKQYNAHTKKKPRRPDEKTFKDNDRKMKDTINKHKLRLAELKYEHDQSRVVADELRKKQASRTSEFKVAQTQLTNQKEKNQKITQNLIEQLGFNEKGIPKKIQDPEGTLKKYQQAYNESKYRLQSEELTTGDEKKLMRDIKVLEKNIAKVQTYMKANVDQIFAQQENTKKDEREIWKTHQEKFDALKAARLEADAQFDKMGENKAEQAKIEGEIGTIQQKRKEAMQKLKDDMDAWMQWQRRERELLQAIKSKEFEEEVEAAEPKQPKASKSNDAKKESAEAAKKREEAAEKVKSVESRRQAAIAAFEQCQKNLKKERTKQPVAGDDMADVAVAPAKKADPNQAEKDLCRSLIAYCQSNMPGENQSNSPAKGKKKRRKKKKKIRLTHKPVNFSNFAKVGVTIPIWSTDLEGCIKSLEEKITSYDNPVEAEEDTKASAIWGSGPWFYSL